MANPAPGADRSSRPRLVVGLVTLAVALLGARRRQSRTPAPRRPRLAPAAGGRALRLADALVELGPVLLVVALAGILFGLGWVLSDLWFVGLVVLFVAGIGLVVWCTRNIPWPRA